MATNAIGSINAMAASGLMPPEPDVTAFKVFDTYPQPLEFGGSNENAKVFFPVHPAGVPVPVQFVLFVLHTSQYELLIVPVLLPTNPP